LVGPYPTNEVSLIVLEVKIESKEIVINKLDFCCAHQLRIVEAHSQAKRLFVNNHQHIECNLRAHELQRQQVHQANFKQFGESSPFASSILGGCTTDCNTDLFLPGCSGRVDYNQLLTIFAEGTPGSRPRTATNVMLTTAPWDPIPNDVKVRNGNVTVDVNVKMGRRGNWFKWFRKSRFDCIGIAWLYIICNTTLSVPIQKNSQGLREGSGRSPKSR
jgi:hypothetical protein